MACYNYDLFISGLDTVEATGNTTFFDYEVYIGYEDCPNGPTTINRGSGTYVDEICADDNYAITLTYYQNDIAFVATFSSVSQQGPCGTPPPTPDITPTPTPTNPTGCFGISFQGTTTITNNCGGTSYPYSYETWRISYLNGNVNQDVDVFWQYYINDPCGSSGPVGATATIPQGSSYVDVSFDSSIYIDCPPDPTCLELTAYMLGIVSADTSCSTLATTPTPTITSSQTPTPTTTTTLTATPTKTPTQTPTATPFTQFTSATTCNTLINSNAWVGSGGRGVYTVTIDVGNGTGNVTLSYNAINIPDRFQVYWNGILQIDTGFVSSCFTTNTCSSFNAQLNALGYPNVSGPNGSATFNKTTQSPSVITVVVTAPLQDTAWNATLGCPSDPTPTPTAAVTSTPTPTTTTTLTATPTPTPTTTTTLTATPTPTPTTTTTLTATPTQTPTTTTTLTRTPTQTPTTTTTLTATPTQTPTTTTTLTRTPTQTPTTTTTLTATPTQTPTTTTTLTATPTQTSTQTPTTTTTLTATPTQTPTTTTTLTSTPTQTPTTTTTLTATPTQTPTTTTTLTATPTQTQTPTTTTTLTATPTQTPTTTTTLTATPTQTPTTTSTLTATPTQTPTTTTTLTATPTQTPTTTTTLTSTPTQTATQTPTTTTTLTATPSQTPTSQLTPTPTNTPTQTNTPSNSPTPAITSTPTSTPTQTNTPSNSPTPSITSSPTNTPTQTNTPSNSPTPSITSSPTNTPTQTNTPSNSATPQVTTTPTQTPTTTTTLTATPTQTNTPSNSATPQVTATQTSTPTQTNTPSNSPTPQVTSTQTSTPTQTNTPSNSATPQLTVTPTPTDSPLPTTTPTPSPTATTTLSATPSQTPTLTSTPTNTPTFTVTPTQTTTPTPTSHPIEFAANGFFYEPSTGNLYATTDETIRLTFIGANVGANFLNPTQAIFTAAIADRGLKFIGLQSGNSNFSLAADSEGIVYKVDVPAASITQTAFESATGGTVSNNTISFSGNDVTTSVTIPDVYTNNGTITGTRIVTVGPNSLTFAGSGTSIFKVVDTTGNPIETGRSSGVNFYVDYQGGIYATSKSFWITNPQKEGFKLRHGSLEGPENGVYYRGKTSSSKIEIPSEWSWLVDFDSITVSLTSICGDELYVHSITDLHIEVRGVTCEYFYVVNGERKDIDDLRIDLIG